MKKEVALWRKVQRENFSQIEPLAQFLELDATKQEALLSSPRFSLNLPRRLASKIEKNTLDDPILRQFVPLKEELERSPAFLKDPTQELRFSKSSKLIQKYTERSLILTTSACAMHCRFCFRQNYPYETEDKTFEKELEILQNDPTICEVILSGGDPLSLDNERLDALLCQIGTIPHVKRVRFHTRFPIGIPERIDAGFLKLFDEKPFQFYFVIHCNHPLELDEDVLLALKAILRKGVPVLNHSVLLRGVNDSLWVQEELSKRLVDNGIIPYYLHSLDPIEGGEHFKVEQEKGVALIQELSEKLSGYGVPKYVQEIPGKKGKTQLTSSQQF